VSDKAVILKNISKSFKIYHDAENSPNSKHFFAKRSYEKLMILDDISFEVKKGEMLGIVGFNGSGKSTLLRIISKILEPDRGELIINGQITPFLELGTGFNPEFSAKENIILYGVLLGFSEKEIKSRVNKILEFAELEKFKDTKIKTFSAGMLAKLSFSTAMEVDPDILLIDEIFAVGDMHFQKKSFDALMSFKKRGKTIIFVSHSLDFVKQFCDCGMFLHEGKVAEFGDPNKIVERFIDEVQKIDAS